MNSFEDKIGGSPFIQGWEEFLGWKYELNLHDIPFCGPRFTWSNNRDGDDLIMERLDRAYASPEWQSEHPNAILWNLPIGLSDHAPILLYMEPKLQRNRWPYQVEAWCLHHPAVSHMILEV